MSEEKIKCLIIDDDPFMRDLLSDKLNQHIPEVEILAKATSGTEGMEMIQNHKPELIFLDVEMLDMTGFEMLAKIKEITFEIIFITSYSHYAIKAIRANALDYLIKPIDLGELKTAIKSYKTRALKSSQTKNGSMQNRAANSFSLNNLILQTQEGELHLSLTDIIRIEGERNYSFIYLTNNKKKLVSKTLSGLEELLSENDFFRCHKSHIVGANHIVSAPRAYSIELSDAVKVPVSRRRKDAFNVWFENYKNENN